MVNTIAIGQLTLPEIVEKQNLLLTEDVTFASEWQLPLVRQPQAIYSVSDVLLLLAGRCPLHQVLAVLKKIGSRLQPEK